MRTPRIVRIARTAKKYLKDKRENRNIYHGKSELRYPSRVQMSEPKMNKTHTSEKAVTKLQFKPGTGLLSFFF